MHIQVLIQEFFDYSTFIKGHSPNTIRRHKYVIGLYCKVEHISTINDVTDENVHHLFFYGRSQRKWSSNTYFVFHKSLLVFFRWCVARGHLQSNPIDGVEKPRLEQKIPIKLGRQDAMRLLELVNNYPYDSQFQHYRNHAIFSMFIFAGLRKNELLKLQYGDVDIDNLTIFVRQGKGHKDRMVPIASDLAMILRKYIIERKKLNKTCPQFFASLRLNIGFTDNGLKWLVKDIVEKSRIKFTIHKLRHTFATLMLEGGCDIYSLSRMMGHSDIKTTTIYLSASVEHLRKQIIKHPLNNLL